MLKIAVINCYDSFVFNLVEILRHQESVKYKVIDYNDITFSPNTAITGGRLSIEEIVQRYDGILLSPGPATPEDFPLLTPLIHFAEEHTTLLGVCLGMQSLAQAYGASIRQLAIPSHGVADALVIESNDPFLKGITSEDRIGRYHSWVVYSDTLPQSLKILATAQSDQTIMAIRHSLFPFFGVQFHPESFISTHSERYFSNWLNITLEYKNNLLQNARDSQESKQSSKIFAEYLGSNLSLRKGLKEHLGVRDQHPNLDKEAEVETL